MLFYIDQSRNVHENKRNMDKMTVVKSDIYGNMTWILRKNSGYDGQFSLIDTLRAGFRRVFAAKIPRQSRAGRHAYSVSMSGQESTMGEAPAGKLSLLSRDVHENARTSARFKEFP